MYALIGGFLLAVVTGLLSFHAGGTGKFDEGYLKGDLSGFRRGVEQTNNLRDKELATLLAETRAEAAEKAKQYQDTTRATEARYEANNRAAQKESEAAVVAANARVNGLLARLRDLQRTRTPDRLPDGGGELPGSPGLESAGTVPSGALLEASGIVIERLGDAEKVNTWFAQCLRAYRQKRDE